METPSSAASYPPATVKKPWYRQLYFWVLIAIVLGILVGWLWPDTGEAMEPIGTTFITA
ncbi:MAG: C4-dicarboxylate transporter DctA, partial [Rhodococcus sp. (in: high G+C Gram-positive bacteria)]